MTLYETIFARRQVRSFSQTPLDSQTLEKISAFVAETEQFNGLHTEIKVLEAEDMSGGQAPHYLVSYCDASPDAYANTGYILQKTDLYIQSLGFGSGWFMNAKPKNGGENHCVSLAFGNTDTPMRKSAAEFKRMAVEKISSVDNAVAQAVRLAPSALNSQPWKLEFLEGRLYVKDCGHGIKRVMLASKLNKIDVGIATRHAVLALEQEGKMVTSVAPQANGKDFALEIVYI